MIYRARAAFGLISAPISIDFWARNREYSVAAFFPRLGGRRYRMTLAFRGQLGRQAPDSGRGRSSLFFAFLRALCPPYSRVSRRVRGASRSDNPHLSFVIAQRAPQFAFICARTTFLPLRTLRVDWDIPRTQGPADSIVDRSRKHGRAGAENRRHDPRWPEPRQVSPRRRHGSDRACRDHGPAEDAVSHIRKFTDWSPGYVVPYWLRRDIRRESQMLTPLLLRSNTPRCRASTMAVSGRHPAGARWHSTAPDGHYECLSTSEPWRHGLLP
jgi:hypothetical protein